MPRLTAEPLPTGAEFFSYSTGAAIFRPTKSAVSFQDDQSGATLIIPLMRLRIVRPLPPQVEGFDLSHFRFGASYDIKPPLSDLLLVDGYGVPEDDDTLTIEPAKSKKRPRLQRKGQTH